MHPLDTFMIVVSDVGRFPIWIALAVAGILMHRMRGMALYQLCLALIVTALVADVTLKPLLHTPRPYDVNPHAIFIGPRPSGYSFPSGHAASAVAAAVALSAGWPAGRVAWFALAALVSYSRIYLGVHYPIDVAGGILIGLACGFFVVGRTRWVAPA